LGFRKRNRFTSEILSRWRYPSFKVAAVACFSLLLILLIFLLAFAVPSYAASGYYTVKKGDSLWLIAQRYGTSVAALKRVNGLRTEALKPGQVLRLPPRKATAVGARSRGSALTYTVREGDCLWLLARRWGVSVAAIKEANNLKTESLKPGQVLCIPRAPRARGQVAKAVAHRTLLAARSGDIARELLSYAQSLLGTRYRWAGEDPVTGFDCSGFTKHVFARFGVTLPHSAAAQSSYGVPVSRGELVPGDLLLFRTYGPGIDHAGIYLGDGRFIHASSRGGSVRIDTLAEAYWNSHFVAARRLLNGNR